LARAYPYILVLLALSPLAAQLVAAQQAPQDFILVFHSDTCPYCRQLALWVQNTSLAPIAYACPVDTVAACRDALLSVAGELGMPAGTPLVVVASGGSLRAVVLGLLRNESEYRRLLSLESPAAFGGADTSASAVAPINASTASRVLSWVLPLFSSGAVEGYDRVVARLSSQQPGQPQPQGQQQGPPYTGQPQQPPYDPFERLYGAIDRLYQAVLALAIVSAAALGAVVALHLRVGRRR